MKFLQRLFKKEKTQVSSGPSVDSLFTKAKAHVIADELSAAADLLQQLLVRYPTHGEARYTLSRVLARLGNAREGAEAFVESIRYLGELDDPFELFADAENIGMLFDESLRVRLAATLTATLAEGRFFFFDEEPFDEEAPPLTPEGFLHCLGWRQVRDLRPSEVAIASMAISPWSDREEASIALGEYGFAYFRQHYAPKLKTLRFASTLRLTDLRKYLRRTAVSPVRGFDELFYDHSVLSVIDPHYQSIPLLPEHSLEESLLKFFAYRIGATIQEWPDKTLLKSLEAVYLANGDEERAQKQKQRQ